MKFIKNSKLPIIPMVIGLIFLIALVVVLATTVMLRKNVAHEESVQLAGKYKDRVGATFAGSETCKKCHERTYLEWKTSLHSRMMRDVQNDPLAIIGDFDSPNEVRTFSRADVSFTLGSQWKQQYLTKQGKDLLVLPAQYNFITGEWKDYLTDQPEKRNWWTECAGCHATGVDPKQKTFVEMGVACEACHGPGSNHVEAEKGYEIPTVISGARLTPHLAAQICGSCHTGGREKSGKYAYPVDYQIHKGVGNIRFYFNEFNKQDNPELFWPSGESRHSNQQYLDWKKSEHAKVGVTCITCHEVHSSKSALHSVGEVPNPLVVIRSKTRLFEDQLCKSCHTTIQVRAAHRIHTFGSCVRCHMPKITKIGEAGDAHSHTFRFMFPQATLTAGGLDKQPNACNSCHHHKDSPVENMVGFLEAAKKNDMPKPFLVHQSAPETSKQASEN
jgi:hypothetical protein